MFAGGGVDMDTVTGQPDENLRFGLHEVPSWLRPRPAWQAGNCLANAANVVCKSSVSAELHAALQNLSAYPRWLVATCGIVVALALLWVVGKVLKWTIYLIVALGAIAVVGGGIYWWMGH